MRTDSQTDRTPPGSVKPAGSAKILLSEYSQQKGREAYILRKLGKPWKAIAAQQGCSVSIARCHFRKWERHIGQSWSNRTMSPNEKGELPRPGNEGGAHGKEKNGK